MICVMLWLLFGYGEEVLLCNFILFHRLISSIQVADYCRDRVHLALAEEIESVSNSISNGNIMDNCKDQWTKTFTECFTRVDSEVSGNGNPKSGPIAPETVGSTAVVAVICSSHMIVANCGDSRAVLCRGKEPIALSTDHKVEQDWAVYSYHIILLQLHT